MFQVLFLGIIQGLGEFLPISSSAHLILAPWFFGWPDQGLAFDLALHMGTLLAVLVYFRKDVWHLIIGFFRSLFPGTRDFKDNIYQKLSWYIILATIPAGILGVLLEKFVESAFRSPLLIACTLGTFGVILYAVDHFGKKTKNLNRITWKDALLIGLAQASALVPGVSRSGATTVAALALSFRREDAARFSFLMAIPITLGAGLVKLSDFHFNSYFVVGFIASAVFGFLAIKYLLRYVAKHDFKIFAWYRVLLALAILVVYIVK